jgi:O-antigen/teichoic acid export membrane protein
MSSSNNRLIVKNTLMLYGQMFISLVIGLYTGRIVISTLGVVDYGIYNIAGGVISSLWFITSALASTSTRYLIYGLGKGDMETLRKTFGNILVVHLALAAIILLFAETVGLWFVMNKLVIPEERLTAAVWVYQFSVVSFLVAIVSAPYNGMIIAHEKMKTFAFISLWESVLKLLIVYFIMVCSIDKLIFYAFLILCVGIQNRLIYGIYCSRHFEESHARLRFNRAQFKEIFSYAGWMCFGNVAHMGCREGFNILLNLFYGPVVNAARGLAVMVQGIVESLGNQFQVAMKPQIIKNYAEGDLSHMSFLIFKGAKFAFFITFAVSLPIMMEIHQFLDWWLDEVPQWTTQFTIIVLAISCVEVVSVSLYNAVSATGSIRRYQTGQAIVLLLFLPVTYVVLKFTETTPVVPFLIQLLFYIICAAVIAFIALRQLNMSIWDYIKQTILPILRVIMVSVPVALFVRWSMPDTLLSFLVVCTVSVLAVLFAVYCMGCTSDERALLKRKAMELIKKRI